MADQLTPEERAAIAAFPEERIQRIPRGQSALTIDGQHWRDAMNGARVRLQRQGAFVRSRETDEMIRELWKQGLTDHEISIKVKLTKDAVKQRRNRMGIMGWRNIEGATE